MSPSPTDRFRIEAVFDALVDLSTDEQMAYLDRTASEDPELREEVLRLLQAHRCSEGFLEAPLAQMAKGLFDDAEPLAPRGTPDRIGPWHIVRPIGRGGMATVYLAQDLRHDRPIAVKVLHPELAADLGPERFQREIRVAAQLQHPHILPVYDSGADAGVLWFTMPYVEGETLRQRLQRTGALPIPEAARILGYIARALAYAHRRGVIHRDIKPENILISQENVFLADFGIAKPVDAAANQYLTTGGLVVGTPTYMAPEQAAADPATDHRADIYAFGILAYELLAGEPPFAKLPLGLLFAAHASREPEPIARRRPDVPRPLASLIARCLRKDPAERWDSADALCGVLQATALPGPSSSMAGVDLSGIQQPSPAVAGAEHLEPARAAFARTAWREAYDGLRAADAAGELEAEDLERLAESAWWLSNGTASLRARERAYRQYLQRGEPRAAAWVALALAEDHFHRLARSVGQGWLRRAERHLEGLPDVPERGWLYRLRFVVALEAERKPEEAMEYADKALEIARRVGDTDLEALALQDRGRVLVALGRVKEGMALMDEAMTAATAGELTPRTTGRAYCNMMSTCEQLGDVGRAAEWYDAAHSWSEPYTGSGYPGICRVHRAGILRLRGSLREAEHEARRAADELVDFLADVAGEAFYELGEIRLRMGDLPGAEEMFGEAHAQGRDPQPGLALLRLAEGKSEAARSMIERVLGDPSLAPLDRAKLLPALVEIDVACGEIAAAAEGVSELETITTTYTSPALVATAALARGRVELARGQAVPATVHLRRASRIWAEIDLPIALAQTRLLLSRAYSLLGYTDEAEWEERAAQAAMDRIGTGALRSERKTTN
jgi:tRNA A-37 threonylcarbamoyl transferase component Bud32/tetratricopeptide (TPR) repeat protein